MIFGYPSNHTKDTGARGTVVLRDVLRRFASSAAIAGAFQGESRLLRCGRSRAAERSERQVALQSPGVKQ